MDVELTFLGLSANGWEWIDIAGLVFVLIGAAGEVIADFAKYLRDDHERKRRLEFRSAVVLLVGLGLELVSAPIASRLNARTIEGERLARVKIEERLAWRELSDVQYRQLRDLLSAEKFVNRVEMTLWDEDNDPEVIVFARQLHRLMAEAKWHVADNVASASESRDFRCGPSTGVVVFTTDPGVRLIPHEILDSADALASGLMALHREAAVRWDAKPEHPERVVVLVCRRRF